MLYAYVCLVSFQVVANLVMATMKAANLITELQRAAMAIRNAKALVVTAGAGLSVDSGLPDFRGREGFWREYPPLKKQGINLTDMNNPRWFENDPQMAWGFFGHCHNMYKSTDPHEGFRIIKSWTDRMEKGFFVYTSNVDGHFQKAGFAPEKIVEVHGSIYYLQCINPDLYSDVWALPKDYYFNVDEDTLHLIGPCPRGPPNIEKCLARPNILMFGDWHWISKRTDEQESRFNRFKKSLIKEETPYVVLEIGAGLAVPTVRLTGEGMIMPHRKNVLIRINMYEAQTSKDDIAIPLPSLEALQRINEYLD